MRHARILILLTLLISSLPLFAQDTGTNAVTTPPPIPEEARRHFVMGETMFKEAKSVDNFTLAAGEFKQATDLAPRWPEARYDLALATEAAGDYSGALDDLKIYQQFKLPDDEARSAQDKIYEIQAKQEMAAKKQIEDQKAIADKQKTEAQHQYERESMAAQEAFPELINKLNGSVYVCSDGSEIHFVRTPFSNPGETAYEAESCLMCQRKTMENGKTYYGVPVDLRPKNNYDLGVGGNIFFGNVTLSADGQTLTERFDNGSTTYYHKQ